METEIEVKSRRTGQIIATQAADSLRSALELLVIRGADLRGAFLRDADLYRVPQLHARILDAIERGGSLEMQKWHTCETTHCRAGWAVILAGPVGKYMEAQMGTAAAGALITVASCPWMEKVPDFYATNEAAMAEIKVCAERETGGDNDRN